MMVMGRRSKITGRITCLIFLLYIWITTMVRSGFAWAINRLHGARHCSSGYLMLCKAWICAVTVSLALQPRNIRIAASLHWQLGAVIVLPTIGNSRVMRNGLGQPFFRGLERHIMWSLKHLRCLRSQASSRMKTTLMLASAFRANGMT